MPIPNNVFLNITINENVNLYILTSINEKKNLKQ